jgi:hypothetical protein
MMLTRRTLRRSIASGAGLIALAVLGATSAQAEPPIRSPEDAACRAEARAKVFSAPNPRHLSIEDLGRGIYNACMKRTAPKGKARSRRR